MRLIQGSEAVARASVRPSEEVVLRRPDLLVLSSGGHIDVTLGDARLCLWGRALALLDDGGGSRPLEERNLGEQLETAFPRPDAVDIAARLAGRYLACLIAADGEVTVFGDSKNRRDLFYTIDGGTLFGGADLSALPYDLRQRYDQAALANALTVYGWYAPKMHSFHPKIRRLGVGERLVLGPAGKHRVDRIPFSPLLIGDYGAAELDEYADLLLDAVRIRVSDGGCNWVYLSGGWDSGALLTLLVRLVGADRVRAVVARLAPSDRVPDWNRPDVERARAHADHFGVPLDVVLVEGAGVAERWREVLPFLRDQQILSDNAVGFSILADHVRRHGTSRDVVFSGEISDGSHALGFATSNTIVEHPSLDFREYSDKMAQYLFGPTFLRSVLDGSHGVDAVYGLLRSRYRGQRFDELPDGPQERVAALISSFFLRGRRVPFYSLDNERVLTRRGAARYQAEMQRTYLDDCAARLTPETVYSWLLHLYNSFHWQGSTIKAVTATAERAGLRAALPHWDTRLLRFLEGMPESWGRGLDFRRVKHPLKQALKRYAYPAELQRGPKSFLSDIDASLSLHAERLYRSHMTPHLKRAVRGLLQAEVLDGDWFDLDYLAGLARDYERGIEVRGHALGELYRLAWLGYVGWS